MGVFDTDWAVVNDMFAETFGVTGGVSITRGGLVATAVTAEAYQNAYDVSGEEEFYTSITIRDYVIGVSDYSLGGVAVEPQRGDRIGETIGGVVMIFEVMPIDGGTQVAHWADADADKWLVHTKRVK